MALSKPHQVRGRITGGGPDCEQFFQALATFAAQNGWALTYHEGPVGFGDKGPIQKITFGFTQKG